MFKLKWILLIVFVLAAFVAVACGSDSSDEEPDSSEASALSTDPTPVPEEPTATAIVSTEPSTPAVNPPTGGVFRRQWADPPTLDPHLTTDTTSSFVVVELFSGLVTINTDLELVPDIAERWEISTDGLQYTFYLRPNAKFHDGKPVTAQDFKWSIERAAAPETASPVAETYLNDIVGALDYIKGDATEISGIRVVDDTTLRITVDQPKAYFLAKLTYPTAFVVDRATVEAGGRGWTDNPNGTGPFRLKEYKIGERIVLERNEHFYREPAMVDTILLNLAGGQSMAMYENDEIDITGVSLFDLERVLDPNEPLNDELVVAPPDFSISYIGFNTSMAPFDDPKFRQALNHAIDKELIASEVLSDLVVPAFGILPPGFPGYNENLEGLRHDKELAQRLLSESAYADAESRPRIVITVPGTGGTIGLDLEVVIEMWRQVLGVEVEIQQVEWATYLEDLNDAKFQAYAGLGWQADYPDPQDFLDILFHTDSNLNHGAYSNPELDAILERARTLQDPLARIAEYRRAEELIVQDGAWVPLWYTGERHLLLKPHVEGYRVTPMIVPKLREIRLN